MLFHLPNLASRHIKLSEAMKKAGIIGGSHFIGTFITLKFLAEDFYVKVQVAKKKGAGKDPLFQNISRNKNLEVCPNNLSTIEEFERFINGCDVLVHCGNPFRLDVKSAEFPLFVPIVYGSGILLKALHNNASVQKVIFVCSAMAFNSEYHSTGEPDKINEASHLQIGKAKFHAEKAANKMLSRLPVELFQIIFISPVEVKNDSLSNSPESTASGLKFLFKEKITPDPFFQKLLERQVIDRLTNIDDLPDIVFRASDSKKSDNVILTKNGQLTAHF